MKALILAGGKGTRLKEITGDLPKPLVPFGEFSLLEHQIRLCVQYGFAEVHLLTGYGSEVIQERIGNGARFGAQVFHHAEPEPRGTAGSVKDLQSLLGDGAFLLLYGDIFIDMDLARLTAFHRAHGGVATLVAHPNDHPVDSDLIEVSGDRIVAFHPKPRPAAEYFFNLVNAGACIMEPRLLDHIPAGAYLDFGKDVFPRCLAAGDPLFAYNTPEYLKDVGTPARYRRVLADFTSGRCRRRRLENRRRCVFLDRDGTLNTYVPLLTSVDDFTLLPGAAEAVSLLNTQDWLCIVTTNQPQVARGELTFDGLAAVHKKMEHLLGLEHAWLDATYFCPHHPDSGFAGEVPSLKIACQCRKPASGMFLAAAQRFNIDLAASYVVGDTTLDIAAAAGVGARSILVQTGLAGSDGKYKTMPDLVRSDLLAAARHITGQTV